ncbi:hypothetical protein AbraIFM66950_008250 [Aspergillus brasiliensis]|nr:hypothetical protein AbraIFM66950_008250 [Aspergillus brasiliensis]
MPCQPPSPHVGVIVNPSARRAACDQCHFQKLRCTTPENCAVCVRCQRLNRQCSWSPPSRSGRPARTPTEQTLARRNGCSDTKTREKRRKRSSSILEMTREEDGHPDSERENARFNPVTTLAPPPVGIAEALPPSGPPSIAEWNMFDIFSFSSPPESSQENLFPTLWTPDGVVPLMSNPTDYLQLPDNGLADLGTQTGIPEDKNPPSGLDSLRDITRELSNVNLSLLDIEQSLHAEPWGPMFGSPAAVITKLSTCGGGDQPDDTLAHGYPLIEIFEQTQRFTGIAKQTSFYFASLPTPSASKSTSSSINQTSSHPDSDDASSQYSASSSSSTTQRDRPTRTADSRD